MIKLSPRVYVFMGLDTIRDPLIKYIGKILSKQNKSWWYKYIYSRNNKYPRKGNVNDLYNYLDELDCFNIINNNKKMFVQDIDDFKIIDDLINIRHECIHIFVKGKISIRNKAVEALLKMALLMDKIDKNVQNEILTYRCNFENQSINDASITVQKETLVNFLKDKIWQKSFEIFEKDEKIDKNEKERLKENMNKTYTYINNKLHDSNDVLQWFNKQLNSSEGILMYKKLKSYKDLEIPTFEDIRIEFYELCGIH